MCGIHGVLIRRHDSRIGPEILKLMGDSTRHRGPNDEGRFVDREILLGMRRLSIIDVRGGHQPIANEDETLWVVCYGEIYNFREQRDRLQQLGHRFRTGSDSEVILH